jgi:gas vesicle protein
MHRFGRFLTGLLFGALVGGITGLLFAPSSGEQMRNRMSSYADQVATDVRVSTSRKRAELERELEIRRHPEMQM